MNFAFQSAGAIAAKYTTVMLLGNLVNKGLNIDPFQGKPDVMSMIEMHDEQQLAVNPALIQYKTYATEAEAEADTTPGLSEIGHGKTFFRAKPNIVSETLSETIKQVQDRLQLRCELAVAWNVGKNWAQCH